MKASTTTPLPEPVTTTTSEEIIPRSVLFGNPTYASPRLSPDGKYLAYLAPDQDDILNVHVRETLDASTSRIVTQDPSKRGIRIFQWAEDSTTILYRQDFEGDENFHLWAVDISKSDGGVKQAKDLTPGKDVKVSQVITNKRYPDEILISTNARDTKVFDMYRCQYRSGMDDVNVTLTLDTENPGNVIAWGIEDESNEVRFALVRNQEDSSNTLKVRDSVGAEWRELLTFPYGEEGNFVEFCNDNSCYITSTLGRDTRALLKVDLLTGETLEEICSNDKCDVGGVSLDEDTKELRFVSFNYARTERVFFDDTIKQHYDVLEEAAPKGSEVSVVSKTRDESVWVVAFSRSDGPTEYKLYTTDSQSLQDLFVSQPELLKYKFAVMEDVRIPTRDGLELVGYVTRAKTEEATPLVLLVHGGPWARDSYGFRSAVQWLANRGYAVLQVNYRGSTGYGKTFLHKGDGEWGIGSMQHDLTDSVQWAIEQGIADPDKVCIYGGSYGGYACLAGLTFTPELYCCGVDIVGPSNVKTLLDSIPSYWGPLRNQMLLKIGDVDNDAEFNKKISPLFHVDNIRAPLLIGQGANDPRVKQAEADQIAFSMQEKGIPVEYVLYPDEGHGFARPDNRIDFNARAELFLQKHLGGRAEEFEQPKGATAVFPLLEKEKASA
ncbi:acylamino acid-releasing enzyme [Nitzschia inconspicua]|uniref:Acylamino acid-releasing enzyme n=1 Tax=Nitzschia inconspicua TaxID=303405 RepID=A0A9K3Q241_9STRA|nr:acylamino acid-releasing enzyme [Nitzschia inconspicua]KAG7365594.1 acylamino acid-releasing enzyme [Nitzschia inconspicua]